MTISDGVKRTWIDGDLLHDLYNVKMDLFYTKNTELGGAYNGIYKNNI